MIRSFKHQGLKRLFQKGDRSKVNADHLARIEDILARLDIAETADFLDLPGYNLHQLRGNLKRFWSVRISGNWRIIFRISDGDVYDVDLVDYH
jgi:proteic killer suppression protein